MKPAFCIWFTGLPSSGKTTLAYMLKDRIGNKFKHIEILDGDEVRKNISKGLGFTQEEREIHNRAVIYVSKVLVRCGIPVVVSLISPYRNIREEARREIQNFLEIYTRCPLEVLMKRDVKGLYRKALSGEIKNFTGVSHPYEEPENSELVLNTDKETPEESLEKMLKLLKEKKFI